MPGGRLLFSVLDFGATVILPPALRPRRTFPLKNPTVSILFAYCMYTTLRFSGGIERVFRGF